MAKFILYLDYRIGKAPVNRAPGYDVFELKSTTYPEAMMEAKKEFYDPETVYLMNICEKSGKAYENECEDGVKNQDFLTTLECRGAGWTPVESGAIWSKVTYKGLEPWFELRHY